jgi:hypothetical protein
MTDDPFPASANENGILLVDLCISDGEGAIPPAARMGIKQGLYFSGFLLGLISAWFSSPSWASRVGMARANITTRVIIFFMGMRFCLFSGYCVFIS